jgi:replicative DNA helicase
LLNEIAVLKSFFNKNNFLSYGKYFKDLSLEPEIEKIYNALEEYYDKYPDIEDINIEEFNIFFSLLNPSLNKNKTYENIFNNIDKLNIKNTILNNILINIIEKYYSASIIETLSPVLEDEEFDILDSEVPDILDNYFSVIEKLKSGGNLSEFISAELDELLEQEVFADGLRWRLNGLNSTIGELRGGSLGHVFARVDVGKTSFLISEAANFAAQLKDDEIIAWFGNEEKGSRIQLRLYSSVLGTPKELLVRNIAESREAFRRNNGRLIKIYDDASITVKDMEKILKKYNVRLAIVDQGDKVRFFGDKNLAEHERLKKLYGKFRELAKMYGCDIITAGQANAEAEGKKFMRLTNMDNSKTGKPGELDFAIGIGALLGDVANTTRFISVCKNKLHNGSKGKFDVHFDALIARYTDFAGEVD